VSRSSAVQKHEVASVHEAASALEAAPVCPIEAPEAPRTDSLEQCVFRSLERYFENLGGAKPHALHEMVLGAIERPLLQYALTRCEGNQSAAAELLGINRNTLRRKLQDFGLQ
jgi:Fis family transcriptional regulator